MANLASEFFAPTKSLSFAWDGRSKRVCFASIDAHDLEAELRVAFGIDCHDQRKVVGVYAEGRFRSLQEVAANPSCCDEVALQHVVAIYPRAPRPVSPVPVARTFGALNPHLAKVSAKLRQTPTVNAERRSQILSRHVPANGPMLVSPLDTEANLVAAARRLAVGLLGGTEGTVLLSPLLFMSILVIGTSYVDSPELRDALGLPSTHRGFAEACGIVCEQLCEEVFGPKKFLMVEFPGVGLHISTKRAAAPALEAAARDVFASRTELFEGEGASERRSAQASFFAALSRASDPLPPVPSVPSWAEESIADAHVASRLHIVARVGGRWLGGGDGPGVGTFTCEDGAVIRGLTLMSRQGVALFHENYTLQCVELPLCDSGGLLLRVVLPRPGKFEAAIAALRTTDGRNALSEQLRYTRGSIHLPRARILSDACHCARFVDGPRSVLALQHSVLDVREGGMELGRDLDFQETVQDPFLLVADRPFLLELWHGPSGMQVMMCVVRCLEALS